MTKREKPPELVRGSERKPMARPQPPHKDRRLKRLGTRNARVRDSLRDS